MPKDIIATHEDRPEVTQIVPNPPDINDEQRRLYRYYRDEARKAFRVAYDSRKRYDWEWLTRDLYRRGYQFSRYNPSNRTVVISTRSQAKIPINILWAQMRTIKNQVVNFRPKWEVMPKGKSEEFLNNARYSGKLLDHYYEVLNLRKLIKETVLQGLIYSVGGPWQIGYDPNGKDGKGEVFIWLIDPFDFYIDPSATSLEDAEYVIKAVRRPMDEIRKNPIYKFYEIPEHGEMKRAASEYKQFLLQALKYQSSYEDTQDGGIVYEYWSKVRVGDENKERILRELKDNDQETKNLRKGEVLMRVVTYLDFVNDPLQVKLIRRSDYPFVIYQADINPLEIYGESWAKHVIPMNRVLNALESSVYQYNYKYAKGRIVIDKNSGVRIITNEHGDVIEKNQGAEVKTLDLAPLPASYQMQIENMRRYLEDIGGAHDVSLGRIPVGVKSGVGIAELKQADATNQTDLVDNLEDFLVKVGMKLLHEISENYDVPQVIEALGQKGDPQHFVVIGEKAAQNRLDKRQVKIGPDVFDIAIIGKQNQISVKIGSWLAYTKEALTDRLKEYYQAGLIDQETFLTHAEFSDVPNIVERTRQEEILKKYRGNSAQGQVGPSDEELADQENLMMVNEGRMAPVAPQDNHQVHLIIHQEYADNPLVSEHMHQHEVMAARTLQTQSLLGPQASQPPAPPMGQSPPNTALPPMMGEGGASPLGQAGPPPVAGIEQLAQAGKIPAPMAMMATNQPTLPTEGV